MMKNDLSNPDSCLQQTECHGLTGAVGFLRGASVVLHLQYESDVPQEMFAMPVSPFTIDIAGDRLDDLRQRLSRTRLASEVVGAGWDYGTSRAYLKELVDYWQEDFDWRAEERH
jgi:hypothetical protein